MFNDLINPVLLISMVLVFSNHMSPGPCYNSLHVLSLPPCDVASKKDRVDERKTSWPHAINKTMPSMSDLAKTMQCKLLHRQTQYGRRSYKAQ